MNVVGQIRRSTIVPAARRARGGHDGPAPEAGARVGAAPTAGGPCLADVDHLPPSVRDALPRDVLAAARLRVDPKTATLDDAARLDAAAGAARAGGLSCLARELAGEARLVRRAHMSAAGRLYSSAAEMASGDRATAATRAAVVLGSAAAVALPPVLGKALLGVVGLVGGLAVALPIAVMAAPLAYAAVSGKEVSWAR